MAYERYVHTICVLRRFFQTHRVRAVPGLAVTDTSMAEVKELIGGYSVIQATSLAEATELAKGAPFLQNHPRARVLVRPILQEG